MNIHSLLITTILAWSTSALHADFSLYVSSSGNDRNPGTEAAPVVSLQRARDLIREQRANNRLPIDAEIVVWIESGTYELTQGLRLKEQDSRVAYKAADGAEVRVIGGREIPSSNFRKVTDQDILSRLASDEARNNVYEVDLKSLGINDFGEIQRFGHMQSVVNAPLELFVNHEALPLARYPNTGEIPLKVIVDPGSIPRVGDYSERGGTFEYSDLRHSRWKDVEDVWIQGTFHYGYADDNIRIESIDTENRQVQLAGEHMYGLAGDTPYRKYFVYNLLEELDSPGEWYLDRRSGFLYFWPREDISAATIAVSILEEPIISLESASDVTIEGLTLEVARGMGIYLEGGTQNKVRNCVVRNVGTSGIFMGQGAAQTFPHITHDDYEGIPVSREIGNLQAHLYEFTTWDRNAGNNHEIVNCEVYNTGSGGIYLSGGSKKYLLPGNSKVTRCLIHNYNRRNKFLWSGINVDGCGNLVSHCEVFNSDFQGIYVRGNDHIFEYNYLHDLAMDSDDTSAWYTGRDPSDRGNVVRYNYFENIGRPDRMVMGIYLDDGACGVEVFGNVFFNAANRGSVFSNSGHNVRVINNIFVESMGPAVGLNSIFYNMSDAHRAHFFGASTETTSGVRPLQSASGMFSEAKEGLFERRLLQLVDIRKPPYSNRYPELVDYMDFLEDGKTRVGMRPRDNLMERNVIYRCPEDLRLTAPHAEFAKHNNLVTWDDPGFVNAEDRDFRLRHDSVVYEVLENFSPIPFEAIGRDPPLPKSHPVKKE